MPFAKLLCGDEDRLSDGLAVFSVAICYLLNRKPTRYNRVIDVHACEEIPGLLANKSRDYSRRGLRTFANSTDVYSAHYFCSLPYRKGRIP